jgi:D-3-phosphoglycerate dehydrogenase / 2-oxoglutarate reductase
MRALVTAELTAPVQEALEKDLGWTLQMERGAFFHAAFGRPLPEGTDRAEAAIIEADPVGAGTLDAMPALRILACVRGEPVNIDVEAATARGIPVLFAPGRNAEAVADFTLGLIFSALRWIAPAHRRIVSGELTEETELGRGSRADVIWSYRDRTRPHPYAMFKGPELRSQVLGLIGFGSIGRLVAERAVCLGARVLVADPYIEAARIAASGCRPVPLDELLREADIVSLHARGSGTPLLGSRELAMMKQGAYLINTSRAVLVDYDALERMLRGGHLGGAALDVFPVEPLPPDSPLLTLPNVTLTPHLAGASTNVVAHQSQIILANLRALLAGPPWRDLAIKNPEVLASWHARRIETG